MRNPLDSRTLLSAAVAALLAANLGAQNPPFNSSFLGSFDQGGSSYGDIWGEGDLAYVAHFGQAEVDIVDISDPTTPVLLSTYFLPSPDNNSSAQDVKGAGGLMFVASESGGSNGVHIVDVRNPSNPTLLTTIDCEPGSFEFIHNVFFDSGWLYICNSSDTTLAIVDLRSYDPDNAPVAINTWTYQLTGIGNSFVHDIVVENGRLYCSGWDSLVVYDVSNIAVQPPQFMGSADGISSHAVWPTEDGAFVVTTEEREGGALRLYEVIDNGITVELVQRDSYQVDRGDSYSAHNPVILGERVYSSWYQGGVYVHEIDRTTKTLELVASFDTSTSNPSGFSGNWGSFPLLGEERVLLSDISTGLTIVDMSAIQISFVDARPITTGPGDVETITVQLKALGSSSIDPGSVTLHASVNGGPFTQIAMGALGAEVYQANLPQMSCDSIIDYYVSADTLLGVTFSDPIDAPARFHTLRSSGPMLPVLIDDFEVDTGWTVSNLNVTDGGWERAVPGSTGGQPSGGDPDELGSFCFVTGAAGGSDSADDLDGGPAFLFSPPLDFSSGDGMISYSRWFFNDDGDDDRMQIDVSNNGGSDWLEVERVTTQGGGGWVQERFRVSDYVVPSANVVVRFGVMDNPNNSVTEGAVDAFRAELFACTSAATTLVRLGTGVNPNVYSSLTAPAIGTDWITEIDASGSVGADLTYVLGFSEPLDPGLSFAFGELLIDVSSEPYITDAVVPDASGLATHVIDVPLDPLFQGFEIFSQGLILGTGLVELTNAIDAVLDY